MMPQFPAFDYNFVLDVVKIPLITVNLQFLYFGWLLIVIPLIYQKYFINRDLILMFVVSQITYIVAESFNGALAMEWNKAVGIPNLIMYFIGYSIAPIFEKGFSFFPSFIIIGKIIPPGIEATLFSVCVTVIILN